MRADVRVLGVALLAGLLLAAPGLRAQPVQLEEVLASAREHAPQVLEALANVKAAEGRRLATEGAFDTLFSASADARLTGFYDGRVVSGTVTRPLGDLGGEAYAGYRLSGGRFPIYEDEKYTSRLGEVKVGALFALLRNREIDDRRFARDQAEAEIALARNEQLLVAIGVQRRAIDAYGRWVALGLRAAVLRDLLALAEKRQDGFRRQVARGLRPAILLAENEQLILRRRALLTDAEQALAVAANQLSLFLRDSAGQPVVPPPSRLPPALPPPLTLSGPAGPMAAARPELRAIDIRLAQARQQLALARNNAKPRLDLAVEASRDLGDVGAGGVSRQGTDSKVGLRFSLPLQQSAARGQQAATQAQMAAQAERRRQLEDQIEVELANLSGDIATTARLVELTAAEQRRAAELTRAEARRLELGASDLLRLQLREEAEADARIRAVDAALRQTQAHAELAAASADLERLGLADRK